MIRRYLPTFLQTCALLAKDFRFFLWPILGLLVTTSVCDFQALVLTGVPPPRLSSIFTQLFPNTILACLLTADRNCLLPQAG